MQQFLHAGVQPGFNLYVRQIVGQRGALDYPHIHAAAFNPGFPPFNPFSVGGDQRHLRPLMAVVIKKNPRADEHSDDGEDPHG